MQELIVFEVAQRQFAVKAEDVVEIIRAVEVTSIPETDPLIAGIINYRGIIVPVIRMSNLLGLNSPTAAINEHMIMIGESASGQQVCLVVDQVSAFVTSAQFRSIVEREQKLLKERITSEIAMLEGKVVPIINVSTLLCRPKNLSQIELLFPRTQLSEN